MAEEKKAVDQKVDKKPAKKDKPSIPSRVAKFFREHKSELKKIVWATPKQTLNNTVFVVVSVIISGAVIGLLDTAFSKAILALADLL